MTATTAALLHPRQPPGARSHAGAGQRADRAQLRADLAHQRSSVVVTGFDLTGRRRSRSRPAWTPCRARSPAEDRQGRGSSRTRSAPSRAPGCARSPPPAGEARAYAEAEMLRRARRFVMLDGVTSGTSDLTVGSHVRRRAGRPPRFEGEPYYATWVHHSFDVTEGFRTHFRAERATLGRDETGVRSRVCGQRRLPQPPLRRVPGHSSATSSIPTPGAGSRCAFPGSPTTVAPSGRGPCCSARTPTTTRDCRRCPRSARWSSSRSRPVTSTSPTSSARHGTGRRTLPVAVEAANNKRLVKSRSGSRLEFDDTAGSPKVAITVAGDSSGAVHKIMLDDAGDSVLIKSRNGALVEIAAGGGIKITANTKVTSPRRWCRSTRRWRSSRASSSARR